MKRVQKGDVDRDRIRSIHGMASMAKGGLVAQSFVDNILNLKTPIRWYRQQAEKGTLRRLTNGKGEAVIQLVTPGAHIPKGYIEDYARKKKYPVNRNTAKQRATVAYVKACKDSSVHLSSLVEWMKDNFKAQSIKGSVNQDRRMMYAINGYVKKGLLIKVVTSLGPVIIHPAACSEPAQTCAKVEYRKPEQLSLFLPEQLRSPGEDPVSNELRVKILNEIRDARVEINKVLQMLESDRKRMSAAAMAFAKTFSGR